MALFAPHAHEVSETFIRTNLARLPFDMVPLFGYPGHFSNQNGAPLWQESRPFRMAKRLVRLAGMSAQGLEDRLLSARLQRLRVDAVIAEYGPTGVMVMGACRRAGLPLIVHFHGYDASRRSVLESHTASYRELFTIAAGIVVKSDRMRQQLLALGAPAEKVLVSPSCVDPVQLNAGRPGEAPPHFLAVGRFVEKKAPHLTVLAFGSVAEACPDARLVMVGDGPLLGPTRRLASALGLGDRVSFCGSLAHDLVRPRFLQVRGFVQHSLTAEDGDSEGTPVAVMEAQMSGLPVVGTRHGGIPDVVAHGETGFLVEEGDAEAMGRHLVALARDPALAARLGAAGRVKALREYPIDRHISDLTTLLQRSIETGRN